MAYFTKTVKPVITASLQAGSTMASGDVLFDWLEFDIPRGSNKLIGLTVLLNSAKISFHYHGITQHHHLVHTQ